MIYCNNGGKRDQLGKRRTRLKFKSVNVKAFYIRIQEMLYLMISRLTLSGG